MGKKKQIRNLESEIERLRKNVIDREVAIDKLLSDTITDQEKNVIKFDRHFAKATAAEFDKYLLSGKTQDYSTVSKVCNFYDNIIKNQSKAGRTEGFNDLPLDEVKVYHKPTNSENVAFQTQGRQYRHTEEGDKVFGELAGKPITHHKVPQDDCVPKIVAAEFNVEIPNKDFSYGFSAKTGPEIKFGNNSPDDMVTIQVPVGSFIVPPTDNKTINEHLSLIKEHIQKEIDLDAVKKVVRFVGIKEGKVNNIGKIFTRNDNGLWKEVSGNGPTCTDENMLMDLKNGYLRAEYGDYVEFKINHGDKFVKEVEYNADGVIKTKITYPDADGAPKTMVDIHDDINFMETIAKMPGCTFQKADYNEKYIFLSDYHISSPYIDEDIVIKEGTIISLLRGNTYGSENTMVLFPYQNVKLMEEKGLVRRLSPLEICGEPQVCAPAKED